MFRPANDQETAAFYLVERTMQRTRPRVGTLGLRSIEVEDGRIERDTLRRLRFRFDGNGFDFEAENRVETRPLSEDEASRWRCVERVVVTAKPVTDPDWNLVSMRIGPRVLSRLRLGTVVVFVPNGTPPFQGSLNLSLSNLAVTPAFELPRWNEAELLQAIDEFVAEGGDLERRREPPGPPWTPGTHTTGVGSYVVSPHLLHNHRKKRSKWAKCPLCHGPVVHDRWTVRIPVGTIGTGGTIRDLRGGYVLRLRETYILPPAASLVDGPESP